MKFAVMGTGPMARTFIDTLKVMPEVELYAVGSRTKEKAEQFKEEYGFEKAYGTYEEMVKDSEVEIVYIATPHSRHYEDMKLCIENHKPVLCEKAFTLNAKEANEIKELANKEKVFVSEAIWPRYMPSGKIIDEVLESGIIGNIRVMTANLSYIINHVKRIVDPELAGGALLDVGIYGLTFADMHNKAEIEKIETTVRMTDTGVDGGETITIFYKDGRMSVLTHGIYSRGDRKGIFYGDKGYMIVENINNPECINVYDTNDKLVKHIDFPKQISGYEYEIEECIRCIKEGRIESYSMPLNESVKMIKMMDSIRNKWNLVYPKEK